ncbi:hypothetical protein IHE45_14G136000 [Dioscorea alata]|uniref:Uncharacterized protein n=1 Tax=Dioscorea alata TaxID=55571 RepID=A0ACB7UVG6_DIOAL|nr:hypothetical protein IHE45_14G136000 [Dioscorea alata]
MDSLLHLLSPLNSNAINSQGWFTSFRSRKKEEEECNEGMKHNTKCLSSTMMKSEQQGKPRLLLSNLIVLISLLKLLLSVSLLQNLCHAAAIDVLWL